ncbi:MAG: DUF6249 domain-containing protein [Candidatus Kapaibacterium sp.]
MKAKTVDTVVQVIHDTVRVTDTSSTYTEIKKGITDGLAESERESTGSSPQDNSSGFGNILVPLVLFWMLGYVISKGIEAKRATRIAMIERGMDPSFMDAKPSDRSKVFSSLRTGMFLSGIGLGLILGFLAKPVGEDNSDLFVIAGGMIGGGIGYIAYHFLSRNRTKGDS